MSDERNDVKQRVRVESGDEGSATTPPPLLPPATMQPTANAQHWAHLRIQQRAADQRGGLPVGQRRGDLAVAQTQRGRIRRQLCATCVVRAASVRREERRAWRQGQLLQISH